MRPTFPARAPRAHPPRISLRAALTLLAGALLAACLPARAAEAPGTPPPVCRVKPQPPLDVRLEALDPLRPGQVARFRLTVVPRVPTDEIRVVGLPSPDVEWVAGERAARRQARRDGESEFLFAVRVPRVGRHALYVRVEITAGDGTLWRRGVGLGLGPNPRAERARVTADGRGGEVLEYEAAPARPAAGAGR